ncbi:MAG: hypothetical protein JO232_20230 [Verrucomicrobia bacterium]|nr:hypothetical protein [Verrucomicrobiota bacterium]
MQQGHLAVSCTASHSVPEMVQVGEAPHTCKPTEQAMLLDVKEERRGLGARCPK